MQPLFDLAHDPHRDNDRDDVALITHQRHRVQPAEHRLHDLHAGGNGPGVLQVGMDHDHADDRAEERIAAEHFRRREGNEDGQEHIGGVGEQLGEHIDGAGGVHVHKAVVDHEVERLHEAHEETGGHDGRDNGHKDVAQCFDGPLVPGGAGRGGLLDLLLGGFRDTGLFGEFLVHLVDHAGAEDDLQLSLCLKDALGALGVFQLLFVDKAVVRDDEPQTGGAVCRRNDVGRAANIFQHLPDCFLVIHSCLLLLFWWDHSGNL